MGKGYGVKRLNENLTPLKRYLNRQVGRPWDKVFADLSAHISVRSAVQKHILDHVKDMVTLHIETIDGVVHERRGGRLFPLRAYRGNPALYVCPKSGLLKRVEHRPRQPNPNIKQISESTWLVRKNKQWYFAETKPLPIDINARYSCYDALLGTNVGSTEYYTACRERLYPWLRGGYVESLRPMTKAEKRFYFSSK